jgi:hypothetical protein
MDIEYESMGCIEYDAIVEAKFDPSAQPNANRVAPSPLNPLSPEILILLSLSCHSAFDVVYSQYWDLFSVYRVRATSYLHYQCKGRVFAVTKGQG